MNWYCINENKQAGPFTDEEFQMLIHVELLKNDSLVRREDSTEWIMLKNLGPVRSETNPASPTLKASEPTLASCSCGCTFPDSHFSVGKSVLCPKCQALGLVPAPGDEKTSAKPKKKTCNIHRLPTRMKKIPHYIWLTLIILLSIMAPFTMEGEILTYWENAGMPVREVPDLPGYLWLAYLLVPFISYYLLPKAQQLTFFKFALWKLYASLIISPIGWLAEYQLLSGWYRLDWGYALTKASHVWIGWAFLALMGWIVPKGIRYMFYIIREYQRRPSETIREGQGYK